MDTYLVDKSVQNVWELPYCIEASCESSLLNTHQAFSVLADLVYMLMTLATTLQDMSYVYPHKDLIVCLCWIIWLWKCQIEVEIYVNNPLEITTHRFQMELESNCHAKNLTLQLWEQILITASILPSESQCQEVSSWQLRDVKIVECSQISQIVHMLLLQISLHHRSIRLPAPIVAEKSEVHIPVDLSLLWLQKHPVCYFAAVQILYVYRLTV